MEIRAAEDKFSPKLATPWISAFDTLTQKPQTFIITYNPQAAEVIEKWDIFLDCSNLHPVDIIRKWQKEIAITINPQELEFKSYSYGRIGEIELRASIATIEYQGRQIVFLRQDGNVSGNHLLSDWVRSLKWEESKYYSGVSHHVNKISLPNRQRVVGTTKIARHWVYKGLGYSLYNSHSNFPGDLISSIQSADRFIEASNQSIVNSSQLFLKWLRMVNEGMNQETYSTIARSIMENPEIDSVTLEQNVDFLEFKSCVIEQISRSKSRVDIASIWWYELRLDLSFAVIDEETVCFIEGGDHIILWDLVNQWLRHICHSDVEIEDFNNL